MLTPHRVRAFPAVLSLSAFFLTSCLIIAAPDKTGNRLRERDVVSGRRAFSIALLSASACQGFGPR